MARAEGDNADLRWWGRLLVRVTGRSSGADADRERRWVLLVITLMVIGSLALVLVLVIRDLSGSVADRPLAPPARLAGSASP